MGVVPLLRRETSPIFTPIIEAFL